MENENEAPIAVQVTEDENKNSLSSLADQNIKTPSLRVFLFSNNYNKIFTYALRSCDRRNWCGAVGNIECGEDSEDEDLIEFFNKMFPTSSKNFN